MKTTMISKCVSQTNITQKKSFRAWMWFKSRVAVMESFNASTQMAKKKLCLQTELKERCGLMATRLFGSLTRTLNRLTVMVRPSIFSQKRGLLKQLIQMVCKFLSSRTNKSKSISPMETRRSTFQTVRLNVCMQMVVKKASFLMAQSRE